MRVDTELKKDRDLYHKDNRVNGVVDLLLNDNTKIFDEVITLVNSTHTYKEFCEKIYIIAQCLSDDNNALMSLFEYYTHLENIYKDSDMCSNLRGALLERLVYRILEKKHSILEQRHEKYPILHISCYVIIEAWKSKKSVDVFYYSDKKREGETFECKVSPINIQSEHIDNLKNIYINSGCTINPGIACFTSKEAVELELRANNFLPGVVRVFGFEDLKAYIPKYRTRSSA